MKMKQCNNHHPTLLLHNAGYTSVQSIQNLVLVRDLTQWENYEKRSMTRKLLTLTAVFIIANISFWRVFMWPLQSLRFKLQYQVR